MLKLYFRKISGIQYIFYRVVKDEVDGEPAAKKVKGEPVDAKEKAALKKQVEKLMKYTNFLKTLTRPQIAEIMEENKEPVLVQSNVSTEELFCNICLP